jgi:hypothetical protein
MGYAMRFLIIASMLVLTGCLVDGNAPPNGPFGISKSLSVKPFKQSIYSLHAQPLGGGYYEIINPPTPHPSFTKYTVMGSPSVGVCEVNAFSRQYTSNVEYEVALQRVIATLKNKYDEPTSTKSHIINGYERITHRGWENTGNLGEISLATEDQSEFAIRFEFDNYRACVNELNSVASMGLTGR